MPVYFIRAGEEGPVKIGWAVDPQQRLAVLQTAHHEELVLLRVLDGEQPEERQLHRRFGPHRIRGEWFRFVDAMLAPDPFTPPASPSSPRAPMRPFSSGQLRVLAHTYCLATSTKPDALSGKVFTQANRKLFPRLLAGAGCTASNAERASRWFAENWPADVAWPSDVPAPKADAA